MGGSGLQYTLKRDNIFLVTNLKDSTRPHKTSQRLTPYVLHYHVCRYVYIYRYVVVVYRWVR